MDNDSVAKAFVEHYYRTFDANRGGLGNLYQDNSMLTFEGAKIQGSNAIVEKLVSLPFQQCLHKVSTVDCQPSGAGGGMLVFVSGLLQISGEQHQLKFSQVWLSFRLFPCIMRRVPFCGSGFFSTSSRSDLLIPSSSLL